MINKNLLDALKPHNNPTYFTVIKDVEQSTECNQDTVELTLHQIHNKDLSEIENETNQITEKSLTISSNLDVDDSGLYRTKLIGYESYSKVKRVKPQLEGITSHKIEVIQAYLSKEIEIEFNDSYIDIPSVIVNIDSEYEMLYRSYSTEFILNDENKYIGVKIIFNNLKTRREYPYIKITIIGDEIHQDVTPETEDPETPEPEPTDNGDNNETDPNESNSG